MKNKSHLVHAVLAAAGAGVVLAVVPVPASAEQDPGDVRVSSARLVDHSCHLERVDRQFVECDNLTGAGDPAPLSVPERL
jgi:hypothetical protein